MDWGIVAVSTTYISIILAFTIMIYYPIGKVVYRLKPFSEKSKINIFLVCACLSISIVITVLFFKVNLY